MSPPLLQGAWSEVVRHRDEIPGSQQVLVVPDPAAEPEAGESEHQKRLIVLDRIFAEADALDLEPSTAPLTPYGQAILEKHRKQGWKV